ncbi:MAG: thiolase family protein, partial [Polyangiaceae bacterium]
NNPAIAAVFELRPGRYPEVTPLGMQEMVLARALAAWDLDPRLVDGLLVCPAGMAAGSGADVFVHDALIDRFGMAPRFAETVNAGGATYGIMAARAATAIATGQADVVLCVGAGRFPPVSDGGGDAMARLVSDHEFEYIYGAFIPALYALVAARHMHERGTTREQLAAVAVTARAWALRNPDAIMRGRGALSVPEVIDSRPIAEPFHLLDCSVPCEGGGAFVVARGDIARRITDRPAFLLGVGEHHQGRVSHARDLATMDAGVSARRAFEMASLAPSAVRTAQLYDAFTINPILLAEETALVPRGHGGAFFAEGRGAPDGDLPLNTYGGLLSFGHTGDASGLSMLVEGARQVMGAAGDRQVRDASVALVHVYGGVMADHCTLLLGSEP